MRFTALAIALAIATPAFAADQPAVSTEAVAHQGDMLRDANNVRLASVNTVTADGSVGIIYNSRYVVVPHDSLSLVNGKLVTKLTKTEIAAR